MPLIQVLTLSAFVAAKSAFAYPHSQSAVYKRGQEPLSAIGVVLVGLAGALLGVGTCTKLASTRGSFLKEITHSVVLLVYLVMHVPSWYRNWKERRRTAELMNGLPALRPSQSVNASVTVLGDGDMEPTIMKFGRTSGTSAFSTPVLSRAATRDTHTTPWATPRVSYSKATSPIPFTPTPEAQCSSTPSITVTPA